MPEPPAHRQPPSPGLVAAMILAVLISACAARPPGPPAPPSIQPILPLLGITIQAGAFENLENAVRLTEGLQSRGLEATFFRDEDGLFKVRFGNFTSAAEARRRAEARPRDGVLEVFYIVVPGQYAAAERDRRGEDFVRRRIVQTARGFLGVPYRWGGSSAQKGFDCSGLTMTAYRLNGYDLPRTSRAQFAVGAPVAVDRLKPADLVFFRAPAKREVSHVGLYIGDGRFLHAPGSGKTIRIDALDHDYYRRHLAGARRFL